MFDRKIKRRKSPPCHPERSRRKGRCPDNFVGAERLKRSKLLLLTPLFLLPQLSNAQCAMCRAVLESEENTAIAEGVNNGIVYLMAVPYILVAVLFYFVYRKMNS